MFFSFHQLCLAKVDSPRSVRWLLSSRYTTRNVPFSHSSSDTAVLSPWGVCPTSASVCPCKTPSTVRSAIPWENTAAVPPSWARATRSSAGINRSTTCCAVSAPGTRHRSARRLKLYISSGYLTFSSCQVWSSHSPMQISRNAGSRCSGRALGSQMARAVICVRYRSLLYTASMSTFRNLSRRASIC